jgi:L-amino acid N-acyltransferase YncA
VNERVLIRALARRDAAELQRCRLHGLRESPEAFLVTYDEVANTPLSQVVSDLLDADIHYVGAFDGEALVGFMRYVRFSREARRHVAEVRSVYVQSTMRGSGIGRRLLQRLIEDAKGAAIESLVLSVLADNLPARRLYEACGFRLYGTEARAIRKGASRIDQALYSLDLATPGKQ